MESSHLVPQRFMCERARRRINYNVRNWKNIGSKILNYDSLYDQVI